MLENGDRVNKYQILHAIAEGGEAIVYRALDTFEHKEVALKVILDKNVRLEPEISKLFLREGKILSEIDNPSIIRIFESNIAQVNGKEYFYHAMELVDSPTLEDWLKEHKPGWKEIIRILRSIASAVDVLHNRKDPILHRDLKPSNIFLLESGDDQTPAQVKIFDFGLAKCEYERTITAPDAFRGTVLYIAPECMKFEGKVSKASDIFCLGRILEQMIGENDPKDLPRWIIDLKNIMCDTFPQDRPTIEEVILIIDEQTENRSWISKPLTTLVSLKNRIRLRRWRMLTRVASIICVILIISIIGYMGYLRVKPGLKLVSSIEIPNIQSVRPFGDYVYAGTSKNGINVVDISTAKSPEIVSKITNEDTSYGITFQGNYAYICDGLAGIKITDISNPLKPVTIASYDTDPDDDVNYGGIPYDIAVDGNYAYIADEKKGLKILDVSDPHNPQFVSGFDLLSNLGYKTYAYGVDISGNYAYIACADAGMLVLDISDKKNPSLVTTLKTQWERDIEIRGTLAYVADSESGLAMIDISDPTRPGQIGGYDSPGKAISVAVRGQYAFFADDLGGLVVLDISNPRQPQKYDIYKTRNPVAYVAVDDEYIYAVSGAELLIFRLK